MKWIAAVIVGSMAISALASSSRAQNYNTSDPGSAPLASPTGGRPVPVDAAEVRRDNTADPGSAPRASTTGGPPVPVDSAELRRDNTADPGSVSGSRR